MKGTSISAIEGKQRRKSRTDLLLGFIFPRPHYRQRLLTLLLVLLRGFIRRKTDRWIKSVSRMLKEDVCPWAQFHLTFSSTHSVQFDATPGSRQFLIPLFAIVPRTCLPSSTASVCVLSGLVAPCVRAWCHHGDDTAAQVGRWFFFK